MWAKLRALRQGDYPGLPGRPNTITKVIRERQEDQSKRRYEDRRRGLKVKARFQDG